MQAVPGASGKGDVPLSSDGQQTLVPKGEFGNESLSSFPNTNPPSIMYQALTGMQVKKLPAVIDDAESTSSLSEVPSHLESGA